MTSLREFRRTAAGRNGNPLAVNGIWALSPGNVSPGNADAAAAPAAEMYFTAGPQSGSRWPLRILDAGIHRIDPGERAINLIAGQGILCGGMRPANGCIPPRGALLDQVRLWTD